MSRTFIPLLLLACVVLGSLVVVGHGLRRPLTLSIAGSLPEPGAFPHRLLGAALRSAVDDSGRVDYAALNASPANLESYVTQAARVSPVNHPGLFPTRDDSMAYWLNVYNGFALTLARDHYPLASLRRLDDPFGLTPGAAFALRRFNAGGRWVSLSDIENRYLRGRFQDPRIHFVLNCAARSCPPLTRDAIHPARIDEQMDEAVRRYLASPRGCSVDSAARTVYLSSLFRWYAGDFRRDLPRDLPVPQRVGDRALLAWIDPFLPAGAARRLRDGGVWRVVFLPWDWRLNDVPGPSPPR